MDLEYKKIQKEQHLKEYERIINDISLYIWKIQHFIKEKIIKKGIGLYSCDTTTYPGEWNNWFFIITDWNQKMNLGQIEKGIMNGYNFFEKWKKIFKLL